MGGPPDVPPVVGDAVPSARPESDDRYRHFLGLSGSGIARFVLDPPVDIGAPEGEQVALITEHGRIAECNEVFAGLYGRKAEAMAGLSVPDLVPPGDSARFDGVRQFVRSAYRLVDGEEVHDLPDGSRRWVCGSAVGLVREGRLLSYWLTLSDVTERKRAEEDRERRGHILEAVAFGAARLLEPGRWSTHADLALERLGRAADVSRLFLARNEVDPDGVVRGVLQTEWTAPGFARLSEEPRVEAGVRWRDVGWGRLQDTMRQGQPHVGLVSRLPPEARTLFEAVGALSFASVPILVNAEWWGLLGFQEVRFERQWSGPEIEALKAAAAVFAAAIERERADEAIRESERRLR
ncbi:MAG TPA: PAS domain S-box protein, partial [Vicinamibacteria bacterium]